MAQIKKFQPGGTLSLNGKTYTAEQINEYINQAGLSSQERAALAGTINAIASGQQRTLDRNANSISGNNLTNDFVDFYGGNEKRVEKNSGKGTRWQNRQARRGSDHHIVNTAIGKLGGIEDYFKNKTSDKTRLYKGSDENGFYTSDGRFLEGPENAQNISRIEAILDAMDSGDLSKYDLQDWDGDKTLGGLTDWYAAQNGTFDREGFLDRLRKNQLKDVDWEILGKMGFGQGVTPQTDSKTSHVDWKGNADSAKRAGVYFTKNSDGTWNINGNDDYLNSTWYGGGLDFLTGTEFEGGGIHNGRLYTREQILNNDPSLQNAFGSWMTARDTAKDHRSWYDLANASGIRFVGDRISRGAGSDDYGIFNTQFNPNTHYNEYWSKYFKDLGLGNKTFDIADMSPVYTNLNGRQVLAYVDPNNTHDRMGIRSVKYVVRNTDGTYTQYDSEDALKAAGFVTNSDAYGFTPGEIRRDLWETIGNKKYHYVQDIVTSGDQNNVILADEYGNLYLAAKGPDGKHLNPRPIDEASVQQAVESPQSTTNLDLEKGVRKKRQENTGLLWSALAQSGRSVLRKNGGKIKPLPEKFQYGGNVGKTKTTTKDNSTEGKRTDITATHKTNGSDGGLTDAEKMQIAAAVGDLAGVGLSFVPGAHIAGSIAGLGSTATRFAADVKKDGFQGKDFWSALGGAALDVASLVPILGTGAKTTKAVKALKAAATPIMKVLSVAGAINGANAMGKVIRGEEVTSEDITAILSGLGSAAIAGKQLKDTIGDARLARQVAQKSKAAITDEKLGKTLPKSRKEISELLENAGTEKKAIDKVKELLGNNATDEAAKDVLKEWGVDANQSRFKGKEGWKEYLKFWKKGEATVSMETPNTDVKSVLGYTLNPFARAKQLGFDAGYVQKSGNLGQISEAEYRSALKAVNNGTANGKQIALVRRSALNPKGFSFEFEDVRNRNSGWGWPIIGGRPKYVSPTAQLKYESPAVATQVLDDVPGIRVVDTRKTYTTPSVGKPKITEQQVDAINAARRMMLASLDEDLHSNGHLPRFTQRIDDEYFGQALPMDYILRGNEFMPARMLAWKKGGKIQFAKCGKKITKHQNTSVLPDWKFSDLSDADKTAYKTGMEAVRGTGQDFIFKGHNFGKIGETKAVPTATTPTLAPSLQTAVDQVSTQNTQNVTQAFSTMKTDPIKAFTPSNNQSVGSAVGSTGKFGQFMQGAAKPLLAGASAIETIGDNNRMFGTLKEGVKEATMAAMPNKVARQSDRMILTAGDPYRQAAQRQLNSNPAVTSDSWANRQFQQQNFDNYNQLMMQGNLAERDEFVQKDAQRLANRKAYDQMDQQTENQRKQMMGQMKGSLAQLEASRQAANSQSRANLRQQLFGFKKGGKMRSTPEQLWLDQNKSTNKFISQLNKQAFELLKMLLS